MTVLLQHIMWRQQKKMTGAYSGKCMELPGAVSQGKSIEELQVNMRAAIQSIVKSYDHA